MAHLRRGAERPRGHRGLTHEPGCTTEREHGARADLPSGGTSGAVSVCGEHAGRRLFVGVAFAPSVPGAPLFLRGLIRESPLDCYVTGGPLRVRMGLPAYRDTPVHETEIAWGLGASIHVSRAAQSDSRTNLAAACRGAVALGRLSSSEPRARVAAFQDGRRDLVRTHMLHVLVVSVGGAVHAGHATTALKAPIGAHIRVGKHHRAYSRDGVVLIPNFLPGDVFTSIVQDTRRLRSQLKPEKGSMAVGRLGRVLDSRSDAHQCLTSTTVSERLNRYIGSPEKPFIASEYPIELRVYREGSGMEWHVDDLLYDQPQCEMVLVLENSSDSSTEFIDAAGVLHSEWTPPNSALLVRAGGAQHRVQPLRRGERTILKMVWQPDGAARREDRFHTHLDSMPGLRAKQRPQTSKSKRPARSRRK